MIQITVPSHVSNIAYRALNVPRQTLENVYGVGTANALVSGSIDPARLSRVVRFFASSRPIVAEAMRQHRTERDNGYVLSWYLHGAEAGESWANRQHRELVEQDVLPSDPINELYTLKPQQLYERFALGAWRFEYGFDPAKAARFVESYSRATGHPVDVKAAFGRGADAVSEALFERNSRAASTVRRRSFRSSLSRRVACA
jgi:hypothetical protein